MSEDTTPATELVGEFLEFAVKEAESETPRLRFSLVCSLVTGRCRIVEARARTACGLTSRALGIVDCSGGIR